MSSTTCADGRALDAAQACTASSSVDPRAIRRAAVRALLGELITYPKPGLVSLVDAGSHDDMDATTFVRSARALRGYFERIALAGAGRRPFAVLRACGRDAEARMALATGGVNTHRGAIFAIGLLAAAAAARPPGGPALGAIVRNVWGDDLAKHRRDAASHGSDAGRRHGVGGALREAASGFPHLYRVVLPAYRQALASGVAANRARVHAFFASLAALDDTNLLHRGGADGLAFAQATAGRYLDEGGAMADDWRERAVAIHDAFRARRLSPGGSADLLAACLFVDAVER